MLAWKRYGWPLLRLLSVELNLHHGSELLATIGADHRLSFFPILEWRWLDVGVCLVGFWCCSGFCSSDFFDAFVLIVFKPLQSPVHYSK